MRVIPLGLMTAGLGCGMPEELPVPDPAVVHQGDLVVRGGDDLAMIRGVTGDLVVEGISLRVLQAEYLQFVDGSVRVWENPRLGAVELPALVRIGGDLSFFDNPRLGSFDGLGALTVVRGTLRINRMRAVDDLRGLGQLTQVGGLYLYDDGALASLHGLDSLRVIDGDAELWDLPALVQVQFPRLERVVGRLDLFDCDALREVVAPRLADLGAYELHECDHMADLGSFPLVEALPGELRVQYNDELVSLHGFPLLTHVNQATIRFNGALTDLSDLGIEAVENTLTVANQRTLQRLALPALVQARGLVINGHEMLEELQFDALERVRTVRVVNNPRVSQCEVEAWLDQLDPEEVTCGANLVDGCNVWCSEEPP